MEKTIVTNKIPITVNMATFPPRKEGFRRRLKELASQCDKMRIYLNGYSVWPKDIPLPSNVEYVLGDDWHSRDMGSQGKMFWINNEVDEYYCTVDDDIVYPENYIETIVRGCQNYQNKAVVSFHGGKFRITTTVLPEGVDPRKIRTLISYSNFEAFDHAVQLAGNGIMCCHPKTIGVNRDGLLRGELHSGDDEDMAIWCQRHDVPIVVLRHDRSWLTPDIDIHTVQAQYADPVKSALQNNKLRSYKRWKLSPKPAYTPNYLPA